MKRLIRVSLVAGSAVCAISLAQSAPLTEARINRMQREVQITESNGSTRPASEGVTVRGSQGVRTGPQSAAELLFPDQTLARLGSDTLFTFETGTRHLDLQNGTLLFQIPKGVGGASIRTGAITAAITGTTGFIERGKTHYKLVLLEGTMRVFLNDRTRESMLIQGGQMLIGPVSSKSLKSWQTVQVDTAKLMKTSRLLNGGKFGPLSADAVEKIDQVVAKQRTELQAGGLLPTNLVIDGYGTTLLAVENSTEAQSQRSDVGGMTPTPTPDATPNPTPDATPNATPTPTPDVTPTPTPDATPTPTPNVTPTPTPNATPTPTPDVTPTPTPDATPTPTPNATPTPTPDATPTPTPNATPTPTPNVTPTPTPEITPTPTPNATPTPTPDATPTPTPNPTPTPDATPTATPVDPSGPRPTPIDGDETADYPAVNDSRGSNAPYLLPTLHSRPNLISNFSAITDDAQTTLDLRGGTTSISQVRGNSTRVANGTIYGGSLVDGPASNFLFGSNEDIDVQTSFDARFGRGSGLLFPFAEVRVFSFEELDFRAMPDLLSDGPVSLAFIGEESLELGAAQKTIVLSPLTSLTLAATDGDLEQKAGSTITAGGTSFSFLHLYSRDEGMTLDGDIQIPSADLFLDAVEDIVLSRQSSATFDRGLFNALGNIRLEGPIAANYLQLDAGGSLDLDGTLQTRELFGLADGKIQVTAPVTAAPLTGTTGGLVSLEAADTITVSSDVAVRGASSSLTPGAGAVVKVLGKRLTGTAISITNTGQIQALLNQATTGPSGKVSLESRGGAILINGRIVAPSGTIDIRNTGANGAITFNGATVSADVVKAGALGTNGQLNIRGGTISADTLLKLYAGGSNGTVRFQENTTLNGASAKIISANTVQIDNQKIITINGSGAAQVFTNNPNFTGSGGNGTTTGTFGGQGATTRPQNQAPGF